MTILISSARTAEIAGLTNNPFFAWDNWAAGAGVTYGGASVLPDGAAVNAMTDMTTEYWRPNVVATSAGLWVIFPTATEIKFAAIAAHNLADLGASVALKYSSDGGTTWFDSGAGAVAPTDNSPVAFRCSVGAYTHWRFFFTSLTVGDPLYVGVAHMGQELVMPMRFYDGFAPAITPTEVQLQANITVGGNFAGASVITKGSTLSAPFHYLDPSFIRGDFKPFQKAFNAGKAAFFAWRPATFSDDLHFVWREGDVIRPQNSGGLNFMATTINMRAHEA